MARGEDTAHHPARKVGRESQGDKINAWIAGGKVGYPPQGWHSGWGATGPGVDMSSMEEEGYDAARDRRLEREYRR